MDMESSAKENPIEKLSVCQQMCGEMWALKIVEW